MPRKTQERPFTLRVEGEPGREALFVARLIALGYPLVEREQALARLRERIKREEAELEPESATAQE